MKQVIKALSRAKTAFQLIEQEVGIIDSKNGHLSPGREIYEIELAFKEILSGANKRMVRNYKGFLVIADNDFDLASKIKKINYGDTQGFRKVEDLTS